MSRVPRIYGDVANKSNSKHTVKTGFTLAEVLVTLAIIGIVAALTIPALLSNNQTKVNHIAWRKSFSSVSQAMKKMTEDNGGSLANVFPATGAGKVKLLSTLKKYFNFVRMDTVGAVAANKTWAAVTYAYNEVNTLDGLVTGSVCGWGLLADGTAFKISDPNPCTDLSTRCFGIIVDVNGPTKKPNAFGKDIYQLNVYSNGVVRPTGWDYTAAYMTSGWNGCNNGAGGGWGCAAKFLISD